jgi:carbon monoxide dehydrogenase subunit G
MSTHRFEVSTRIENTPEAVMSYIANANNRPFYLSSLKSVTDVKEVVGGAGTTWKWTWVALGMEWQGTGRCTKFDPGKVYAFKTEGAIESTWTYTAEKDGNGTRLTVQLEYDVPEKARSILPTDAIREAMKKTEAERAIQHLKVILDR